MKRHFKKKAIKEDWVLYKYCGAFSQLQALLDSNIGMKGCTDYLFQTELEIALKDDQFRCCSEL